MPSVCEHVGEQESLHDYIHTLEGNLAMSHKVEKAHTLQLVDSTTGYTAHRLSEYSCTTHGLPFALQLMGKMTTFPKEI